MKVVFITPVTPYKENLDGPSAHPYHLMIERSNEIDITIYSFNDNNLPANVISEVEKELNVKIKLLETPKWIKWLFKFHLTFIRLLLRYPINYYKKLDKKAIASINAEQPDLIWGYSQEFSKILNQFKDYKRLHTVPDSYCLHWYRRLGTRFTVSHYKEFVTVVINYIKYIRLESSYDTSSNIVYHFVGDGDRKFALEMNPSMNARFIHHPHYNINKIGNRRFHKPKIKLLLAGRYDLYSYEATDDLFDALAQLDAKTKLYLKEHYEFTILGKGWKDKAFELEKAGYTINLIEFIPDYIEEIIKYDIQLNPISVGTGTKGKVLDAISNGLLEIGTKYALENISALQIGASQILGGLRNKFKAGSIVYKHPQELIDLLLFIPSNIEWFEEMAINGQKSVLFNHNRAKVSKQVFHLYDELVKLTK